MDSATRALVEERAGRRCEYCKLHASDSPLARLHIEHIRPRKHGGSSELSNLALACIDCNLHKGPNLTGIDPDSGKVTELFNPRAQSWDDHFGWRGIHIEGLTPEGRTTVIMLAMNSDEQLALRSISNHDL